MGFTMTDDSLIAYYLEAAPSDQSASAQWGGYGTLTAGVSTFTTNPPTSVELTIGDGRKNTQLIVSHLNTIPETGRAAQLCISFISGGKSDWFLPSLGELSQLYLFNSANSNACGMVNNYWSSSQLLSGFAWYQNVSNGNHYIGNKGLTFYVRAIRAF
jgi:hypothetical protein